MSTTPRENALLVVLAGLQAFTESVVQQVKVEIEPPTEGRWLSLAEAAKRLGFDDRHATKDVKKLCTSGELIYRKKSDNANSHYQVWSVSCEIYQAKEVLSLLPDKRHFDAYRQRLLEQLGKA